jgi:glycosyltransferase involved in cell wall biosynthesis
VRITHLLYLSQKPGQNPFSGAETPTLDLVADLARHGHGVELLAVEWNSGPLIDERLAALERDGVRVTRVVRRQRGWPRGRLVRAAGCWWRLARELQRPRDLVHLHLDLAVAPVLCRVGRVRQVVATIHSDDPIYETLRWRLWSRVLRRLVHRFVGITNRVASHYAAAAGLSEGAVPVIPYGVTPDGFASSEPRVRRGGPVVIGVVGRLVAEKNPLLVAEVLRREPDWRGVFVGEGPERGGLERFIAENRLDNIRLAGAVPFARRLFSSFDVLVLASRWEGLGLVLVEAMLAGVPIVASRAGAIPEVLGDGRFGVLFASGSVDDLHAKLRSVVDRRVDIDRMTSEARAHALERYHPDRVRAGLLAVYQDLSRD